MVYGIIHHGCCFSKATFYLYLGLVEVYADNCNEILNRFSTLFLHYLQASSSSLDHMHAISTTIDDNSERRNSIDNRQEKIEGKSIGNGAPQERKRPSLDRRSSSGDRLSVTPDNLSPNVSGNSLVTTQARGTCDTYMYVYVYMYLYITVLTVFVYL